MQKLSAIHTGKLSLFFLFIFLCSCKDNCADLDCLSQDSFEFTLKSETSGDDLLFSNNPQLTENDIEVFYLKNGVEQTSYVHFDINSVRVGLVDGVEEYNVRALDKTDIINVQFQRTGSSECCPSSTRIDEITINGSLVTAESDVIELLR